MKLCKNKEIAKLGLKFINKPCIPSLTEPLQAT